MNVETTYTYDEVGNRKSVTDALYLYGLDIIAEQTAQQRYQRPLRPHTQPSRRSHCTPVVGP